jgi:polysaccharide biosynthesis protein PslJ
MYRGVRDAIVQRDTRRSRQSARDAPIEPFDGSRLLCIYLALLILIPSNLAISALGAAGSPANIFGVVLLGRWLVARAQGATPRGWTFLRGALTFFALAVVASYLAANLRPLGGLEVNGADRGLIRLMSWSGVLLVAMDGLPTRRAFRRVTQVAAAGGVVIGLLGLLQATAGINLVEYLHIPGLHPLSLDKTAAPEIRNGLPRIYATTSHPIEYATVLVLLIAIAAPLALKEHADRRSRWWFLGLITMGITFPLAVARSGFLAAAMLAIVVIPRLPRRARRRVLIALPFGLLVVHSTFPGLLGTIRDLFLFTADGEEHARTDDYPVVAEYVHERPLFGWGFGTYLSTIYRVLDNQYLLTLIETGLVGFVAYIALHVSALRTAQRARKIAVTIDDRLVCQCLVGAPAAALASSITFDSFSFPMFAGLVFFSFGLSGAFSRILAAEAPGANTVRARSSPVRAKASLKARAALALACVVATGIWFSWVKSTPITWISTASAVVTPANSSPEGQFNGPVDTSRLADLVQQIMVSDRVHAQLRAQGYRAEYDIAIASGSLARGTEVRGDGPLIQAQAQSHDPVAAESTIKAVMADMSRRLSLLQADGDVDPTVRAVFSQTFVASAAVPQKSGGKRAYVALLALILAFYLILCMFLQRIPPRRRAPHRATVRRRIRWLVADVGRSAGTRVPLSTAHFSRFFGGNQNDNR